MSAVVIVLRTFSLLVLAGPMLLRLIGPRTEPQTRARREDGNHAPVAANLTAFALFFPLLLIFSGAADSDRSLLLAVLGLVLATGGAAVVVRSRMVLGSAWSLVPQADQETGVVTTGPYRLIRHPIYLGLILLTAGQSLAFCSWPAMIVMLFGIVPTFAWRARAEEKLLCRIFGERYKDYQQQTKMIIPHLF